MVMNENKRLLSLDVLRGFDLMLLVALQPVLVAVFRQLDCEALNTTLLYQLDHAEWEGIRVWDMVMPLFLFMSGVTMPYSLPKYRTQNGNLKVWARVAKRFVLLFALGMLVQGNVLALNHDRVYIYSNTLQAIAVGYLLAVPMVLYMKPRQQIIAIAALLAVYSIPMHLHGGRPLLTRLCLDVSATVALLLPTAQCSLQHGTIIPGSGAASRSAAPWRLARLRVI